MINKSLALASIKQFIKFCMVGVANTVIALSGYYLLLYFGVYYLVASIFSGFAGIVNSYILNSIFVFSGKGKTQLSWGAFVRMSISYLSTMALSFIVLFVLVDVVKMSPYVAPFPVLAITTPLNFLLVKYWAFTSGTTADQKIAPMNTESDSNSMSGQEEEIGKIHA